MKIKVGTRGSRLAVTQTQYVIDQLKAVMPDLDVEIVIIKTKGDQILHKSLEKIGDKGLFVKEIEAQLIAGHIDLAIHSMKDMPSESVEELLLLPVTRRESPGDVIVTPAKYASLKDLPNNPTIATGSKRRTAQIQMMWEEANIVGIRGNVETRIEKMLSHGYDGTVLAAAGIERLHLESNHIYTIIPLSCDDMIPAPAQGILGGQIRIGDENMLSLIRKIIDPKTEEQALLERSFMKDLNGSCHMPMGAYYEPSTDEFYGIYGDEACTKVIRKKIKLNENKIEQVKTLAKEMIEEVTK